MFALPDRVRRTAASHGALGTAWLADLPDLVETLCADWALTPGQALSGGSAACVLRVDRADGTPAVLKIAPPWDTFADQLRTLVAAEGRGYARVFAHDAARGAAVLELLGPQLDGPFDRTLSTLAAMLREAWALPLSVGAPLDKAAQLGSLIETLWPSLGKPCSARLAHQALSYVDTRRRSSGPVVVCHGDPHPANALAVRTPRPGSASGYVFVDPDGFVADPAYDLGVVVRDHPVSLLRAHCAQLSAATGVDAQAIWEWGFVERVTSGLFLIRHGHEVDGRALLASAEHLLP